MADGEHVVPLATSQDHKRLDDGDRGPNTGGMGAYSPAPVVTPELHARVMREIIQPDRARPGRGRHALYRLPLCRPDDRRDGAPKVLEYNCRLGDPETQPILSRLRSDLTELCEAALARRLNSVASAMGRVPRWVWCWPQPAIPKACATGDVIEGLDAAARLPGKVFHAGTRREPRIVVTNGGRVLCAVGLGDTVSDARRQAYTLDRGDPFSRHAVPARYRLSRHRARAWRLRPWIRRRRGSRARSRV